MLFDCLYCLLYCCLIVLVQVNHFAVTAYCYVNHFHFIQVAIYVQLISMHSAISYVGILNIVKSKVFTEPQRPVEQPRFLSIAISQTSSYTTRLQMWCQCIAWYARMIQCYYICDVRKSNTVKQKGAFPPNFIHSLDAVHMMLTAICSFR